MTASEQPTTPSIDGRTFDMVSSTASRVDPDRPSRFHYAERSGVVWGEYGRDTVDLGRFVGTREGDRVDISFVHRTVSGSVVTGTASSVLGVGPDGVLRLTEDFVGPDGKDHVSVCEEVTPDDSDVD